MSVDPSAEERRLVLEAFSRALSREAHNLARSPRLLWHQLYNRLRWADETISELLVPDMTTRSASGASPWLRLSGPFRESELLIRSLAGHAGQVNACKISPDGTFIVSASDDYALKVWDVLTGAERMTLGKPEQAGAGRRSARIEAILMGEDPQAVAQAHPEESIRGHTGYVNACEISSDGRFVVSASDDRTLRVWDVATGAERVTLSAHDAPVTACAISPSGGFVLSASDDHTLRIWDTATGAERDTLARHAEGAEAWPTGGHEVKACAISPDGSFVVSASNDHTLKIWDASTGAERATLAGHSGAVLDCAISPDGGFVVSASNDHTLKIWDASTGAERATLAGHSGAVLDCGISPDGGFVVSASADNTLKIWDASTGAERATLAGHGGAVLDCAISPDAGFVVSASADNSLKIWEPTTGTERAPLVGHAGVVSNCAICPDGSFIVSASKDRTLKLWDAKGIERTAWAGQAAAGHRDTIEACVISSDGSFVASAGGDGVKLWDATTGLERATFTYGGGVSDCAISPDCSFIVSASYDTLWLGQPEPTIRGVDLYREYHRASGRSAGGISQSWSEEAKPAHFWDVSPIFAGPLVWRCSVSPDGTFIVSAVDNSLRIFEAATGREQATLDGHTERVEACAISPDGSLVVSASADETLRLWALRTPAAPGVLRGHTGPVLACAISPDGRYIVSASADETVRLWDVMTGHALAPSEPQRPGPRLRDQP